MAQPIRVTVLHNFYRGVLPSGEDLNVREHQSLVGDGAVIDIVQTGNNFVVEHPIRGRARAVSAALGLGSASKRYVDEVVGRDPDVVHIENLTPLIPESVVGDLLERGLPVVRRWGNFRFRCPSGDNFRDGRRCVDCSGSLRTLPVVLHGCYGSGRGPSAVVALRHGMVSPKLTHLRHLPISRFLADELRTTGVPEDRITVIPNSVPDSTLDPSAARAPGGGRVLFLGALLEKKGIGTLLSAWTLVAAGDTTMSLTFLGDGPLRPVVEEAARRDPRIRFVPTVPYDQARLEVHRADVVVVPSEWDEPFGRVVIEAFAEGTPVVVSDRAALPELLAEDCGRTAIPGDPADLAEQIGIVLAADAPRRAQMSDAVRARHRTSFSQQAVRSQWLSMYEEAVGRVH
ncbi:MAG: glycosyltransferase [Actinobacteria bacterium]|nr:glycosyltransferase [Actinomycetota bacterium]